MSFYIQILRAKNIFKESRMENNVKPFIHADFIK